MPDMSIQRDLRTHRTHRSIRRRRIIWIVHFVELGPSVRSALKDWCDEKTWFMGLRTKIWIASKRSEKFLEPLVLAMMRL